MSQNIVRVKPVEAEVSTTSSTAPSLPVTGFVRLWHIVGDKKRGIPALLPISKSSWWNGVKDGKYPKPVKLSERTTAWRVEDIRALIEQAI